MIRRVLIRARQQFGVQSKDIDSSTSDIDLIEVIHMIQSSFRMNLPCLHLVNSIQLC